MAQYRLDVTVDGVPFLALVHISSWPKKSGRPCEVWVEVEPDLYSRRVEKILREATAQPLPDGFKPRRPWRFSLMCRECIKSPADGEFRDALMLPSNARIEVSTNIILGTSPIRGSRCADLHSFCLIHGHNADIHVPSCVHKY